MAEILRCACGKRRSKWAKECTECHRAHMDELHTAARAIVKTGKCPQCGSPLKRNLAMAGWWQCARFGEPGFRDPQWRELPYCSFQTFTE